MDTPGIQKVLHFLVKDFFLYFVQKRSLFLHFCDMSYNIMPLIHDSSDWMSHIWIDLGCMAFMGGCVSLVFLHFFKKGAPYPQKDPRIAETMGVYVQLHSEAKAAGK